MNTLIEILDKHKASMAIPLKQDVASPYSEYQAVISFEDGKIEVKIYDDEGGTYGYDSEDPLPIEWFEEISLFVAELRDAKIIPEYTLNIPTK